MSDEPTPQLILNDEELLELTATPIRKGPKRPPVAVFVKAIALFTDRHSIDLYSRQYNKVSQLAKANSAGFVSFVKMEEVK
jgi:hypothetical protein